MNRKEARQLLNVYRPGGADAADPQFAEALKHAERDPSLTGWFGEQRGFDDAFAKSLKRVPVPAELQESILAARKIIQPRLWRDWRARAAVAAVFLALAIAGGVLATGQKEYFPAFRAELIDRAWDGQTHLDLESTDVLRVKQWLARQNVTAEFTLPKELRASRLLGCRIVETDGQRVPMLCLAEGPKHMHLFIVDGTSFTDLPAQGTPDFQKCGAWKTASWQHGGNTYVLTGMKYQTFVSKFRKSGRWTISG